MPDDDYCSRQAKFPPTWDRADTRAMGAEFTKDQGIACFHRQLYGSRHPVHIAATSSIGSAPQELRIARVRIHVWVAKIGLVTCLQIGETIMIIGE